PSSAVIRSPTPSPPSVLRPPILSRRRDPEAPPAAPRMAGAAGLGTRYPMPGPVEPAPKPPAMARPPPGGVYLSPRMTAIFGGRSGLATVTSVVALLIQVVPPRNERAIIAGTAGSSTPETASVPGQVKPEVKKKQRVPIPGPWRVAELEKDPSVLVESGSMD